MTPSEPPDLALDATFLVRPFDPWTQKKLSKP